MLIVLSPSKTLDETPKVPDISYTQPRLLIQSQYLIAELRNYSTIKLGQLMGISDKLADLNFSRYRKFSVPFDRNNSIPSLFCFKGDVYEPMDVSKYKAAHLEYAQGHVRILSGLYGLLRPLDLMQPYRLEMGTALKTSKGKDLYQFWAGSITKLVNEDMQAVGAKTLVNLASEEYFKVVRTSELEGRLVNIVFKEKHKGALKIIGIHAKKARGMMADYVIRNKIEDVEKLKKFKEGGYIFQPALSSGENWVFVR